MICAKCQKEHVGLPYYTLAYNNEWWHFCSRTCLVEHLAPELNKAVSVRQWVPTEEDQERMSQ